MNLAAFRDSFRKNPTSSFETAVSTTPLSTVCVDRSRLAKRSHTFNTPCTIQPKPTNQKSSGRCWLFAALNMVRNKMMNNMNLPTSFELSQNHLFFWDKLERANYFLRTVAELAKTEPRDQRLLDTLFDKPISDGGQWSMVINLVNKYGLIPQDVHRESHHSGASSELNWILNHKLREWGHSLLNFNEESVDAFILDKLQIVYNILCMTLGQPTHPEDSFTWEYYDKKDKYHKITATPLEFNKKHTGIDLNDFTSVVHDPRHEYGKKMTVMYHGNIYGGLSTTYNNLPIEMLEKMAINMIKNDIPVWFGCDMSAFRLADQSLMDTEVFSYDKTFDINVRQLSKADRLTTGDSSVTHAMVFTAVHLNTTETKKLETVNNQVHEIVDSLETAERWRVENSWGSARGDDGGYYTMSRDWFYEYLFEIVAPVKDVESLMTGVSDVIMLPLWDPLGNLA